MKKPVILLLLIATVTVFGQRDSITMYKGNVNYRIVLSQGNGIRRDMIHFSLE